MEDDNVTVYTGPIIHYELSKFKEESIKKCIKHHKEEAKQREGKITLKNKFEVRWHFVTDGVYLYHYMVYKTGIGSKLLSIIEDKAQEMSLDTLGVWIGTTEGKEKSRRFLEKNNFDDIWEEDDEAHGLTLRGEKNL